MAYLDYAGLTRLWNKIKDYYSTLLGGKTDKVTSATSGNFAGLDSNGNLTDSGSKASDFATAAQGLLADSAIQSVALAGGTNNGTVKITIDGTATDNIAITGLGSAAYTASNAYDAAGAAAAVVGTTNDTSTDLTIYGVKAYVDSTVASSITSAIIPKGSSTFANLPTPVAGKLGWMYNVSDSFTINNTFIEYDSSNTKTYPAGTNVYIVSSGTNEYKYDVLAGFIDLSGYQPALSTITNTEVDALFATT